MKPTDGLTCPTCGGDAEGTVERLTGVAEVGVDDDRNVRYVGWTSIDWNSQESVLTPDGRRLLTCSGGHEWPAPADLEIGS